MKLTEAAEKVRDGKLAEKKARESYKGPYALLKKAAARGFNMPEVPGIKITLVEASERPYVNAKALEALADELADEIPALAKRIYALIETRETPAGIRVNV